MPHHEIVAPSGVIRKVFGHRFTLETKGEMRLADLGAKGVEIFPVSEGMEVSLEGEERPFEVKVIEIAAAGEKPIAIRHEKPHDEEGRHSPHPHDRHDDDADPRSAIRTISSLGWSPKGEPRRKPKHFEAAAHQGQEAWAELHADLDGGLYEFEAPPPDGGKWAALVD